MENVEEGRSCGAPAFKVSAALLASCVKSRFADRTFKIKEVAQTLNCCATRGAKTTRVGGNRVAPSHLHIASCYRSTLQRCQWIVCPELHSFETSRCMRSRNRRAQLYCLRKKMVSYQGIALAIP